jgi:undecaprenyl-diphosphatase
MEALVLGAGMIMTVVAVNVGKSAVDRPRPPDELVDSAGSSFPSGHAAYAIAWVALAIVAVRVVPALRGRWLVVAGAIVVALVVAATRVYLRVHWLSDVSAGAGVAALCWSVAAIAGLVVAFVRHNDERR